METNANDERLRKWRLILGAASESAKPGSGSGADIAFDTELPFRLSDQEKGMDDVLEALYDPGREGGLGPSSPNVGRWLGDIRRYFPTPVVRLMQQDALQKLGLTRMLLEPELLDALEPDIDLVATLLTLRKAVPEKAKASARTIVRKVAEDIERRLRQPLEQAVRGSLRHRTRNLRPSLKDMDWPRTIRANLKHYQPEFKTVIPETLIGFGRRRPMLREVLLVIDLSGSMATSVVYAGIIGSILASLRSLRTRLIVFDTAPTEITENLDDPVDLLFGLNLGGGTDIGRALAFARDTMERPEDTTLFLLSDLFEGPPPNNMLRQMEEIRREGTTLISLLALSDKGTPAYEETLAGKIGHLGIPAFASTPDRFASLLSTVLNHGDLAAWMDREGIQPRNTLSSQ